MISKHVLLITFLNKIKLILHIGDFKYFYQTQIILFSINHLLALIEMYIHMIYK